MWIEVIKWVSIVLLWIVIVMNIGMFVRTNRIRKRLVKALGNAEELLGLLQSRLTNSNE